MFEPWTTGNIPGQRVATLIAPRAAGKGIKMAKNPLLIVGGLSMTAKAGEKMLIDYVVEMAKELPVVATANSLKGFTEKNIAPAAY
ncbi:MAG: carbon monoxide dehydrogenase beta subunit family protein, partial [Candidatus Syntropharchaeia archaeon]